MNTRLSLFSIFVLCCTTVAMNCSSAQADLVAGDQVVVDFGGTDAMLTNVNNFAVTTDTALSPITDLQRLSDGNLTGASLSASTVNVNDVFALVGGGDPGATLPSPLFNDEDVITDALASNGTGNDVITLTFSGLSDPNLVYTISGGYFRTNPNPQNFPTNWTIGGVTQLADAQVAANSFVTFEDVVADANGDIVITLEQAGSFAAVSQVSITAVAVAVPEPSSLCALMALSGLVVSRRRRRA